MQPNANSRISESSRAGVIELFVNAVLLQHWMLRLGLASPSADLPSRTVPPELAPRLNDLYHDGERYIEFCLALSVARRALRHGCWIAYVNTPGRFDFTLRTAQRRQEVGDVLLQLNATALSHLPRRAQSVNKLARLGPTVLLKLSESGRLRRERTPAEVDAITQEYLGAPKPRKQAISALIEKAADVARETHRDWTEQKFDRVEQSLLDLTGLVRRLRTPHSEKVVRLAARQPVASPRTANLIPA